MDSAVLAYLELGQVKSERFRLPHEMLQLAVSLSRCARRRERALDAVQVRYELGGRFVPASRLPAPCRPQAVGDVKEKLAMLLRRRAFLDFRPASRIGRAQGVEAASEVSIGWRGGRVRGEGAAYAGGRGFERKHHVLGLDEDRLGGDPRPHGNVAI